MSSEVFLATISIVLGTILVIYAIRHFSAMQYAKLRAAAEAGNTATLSTIQAGLDDIRTRLGAIEKILKNVE